MRTVGQLKQPKFKNMKECEEHMVDAIEEGERWYSLIDMLQKDIKDFKSNIIPCNDSSYSV